MRGHASADGRGAGAGARGVWGGARERGDPLAKLKSLDAEAFPQEILAEEEPKYLRRQKPLEIKRRKFGRKAWTSYLHAALWIFGGLAVAWAAFAGGRFLLRSPGMALLRPEQIALSGNHYVLEASVVRVFAADRGRSVLRIPLEERRREVEAIPWVERAVVRRALPNRIAVEITERTPVAFLRDGGGMALVDAQGVILDRPLEGDFHFPVVTGISPETPAEERERRLQLFTGFSQEIESAHPGALDQVSEVDLSDAQDLRATFTGLGPAPGESGPSADEQPPADAPVLVHFGDGDFAAKYRTLEDDIAQWRAAAGSIESVDLRFGGEAVVNPDAEAAGSARGARGPR